MNFPIRGAKMKIEKLNKRDFKEINLGNLKSNILFLKKTKLLNKNKKILEIGCGRGSLVDYLIKQGYNIKGIDSNKKYLIEGTNIHGNIPIKYTMGEDLNFPKSHFDIVLSFDVFEHIKDTDRHLQEVKRVLKKGGYYLMGTPNKLTNIPWEILQTKSLKYQRYHCSLHTY